MNQQHIAGDRGNTPFPCEQGQSIQSPKLSGNISNQGRLAMPIRLSEQTALFFYIKEG